MSAPSEPAGFVRSADGTRIAFWRRGSGPPVVIVHGGLGTSLGWEAVGRRLAYQFEVFVFDRRGRGHSGDHPGAHSLDREIADVEALLDVAGRSAALLGHSFGGAVALETARRAEAGQLAAVAVYEPAVGVDGAIPPADIERMEALISGGEHDAALDIAIAGLDDAGLVANAAPYRRHRPADAKGASRQQM